MMTRRLALKYTALTAASTAVVRPAWAQPAPPPAPAPTGPFTLPPLPYPVDALEPHIDARTMEIHHGKHHAAYVANLNKAVAESPDLAREAGETLIAMLDSLPEKVRTAVRNNGGGHVNHTLFWQMMTKNGGGQPKGEVAQAIDQAFGSFNAFQDAFTKAALSQFGSGWAWLTATNQGQLYVESSANQDSPYMPLRAAAVLHPTANPAGLPKRVPLLGVDVWEHAYYLKYQNRRADYLAAFFNVIHWEFVNARFRQAMGRPD